MSKSRYTLGEVSTLVASFMDLDPGDVTGVLVILVDRDGVPRIGHNAPTPADAAIILRTVAAAIEARASGE